MLFRSEDGNEVEIFGKERQDEIFDTIGACIKLSICYIHNKREPQNKKYTKSYYDHVSVKQEGAKWKITRY